MRLLGREVLDAGKRRHSLSRSRLDAWAEEIRLADWRNHAELKRKYPKASIVEDRKVIFDIGGNRYRIVALVDYVEQALLVLWFGTHAEYDRIDVRRL